MDYDLYHREKLKKCPLSHTPIMLAPRKATGQAAGTARSKGIVGRIVAAGVMASSRGSECLTELGAWVLTGEWDLNSSWLEYECTANGLYPFVLTGQRIDRAFYDHLNSYSGEAGSDGVVRVAAANLNYSLLTLEQQGGTLKLVESRTAAEKTAFAVLPGMSHSGDKMGIIRSVTPETGDHHPTAQAVLKCLAVNSSGTYNRLRSEFERQTAETQETERKERVKYLLGRRTYTTDRYSQFVFRFRDDRGNTLADYDLFLTAGPGYSPNELPPGFFVDRQRNQRNPSKLTYYVNFDVMHSGLARPSLGGKFGFRLVARPDEFSGRLVYYCAVDFHSTIKALDPYLQPNQTLMVDFILKRHVDEGVYQLTNDQTPGQFAAKRTGTDLP